MLAPPTGSRRAIALVISALERRAIFVLVRVLRSVARVVIMIGGAIAARLHVIVGASVATVVASGLEAVAVSDLRCGRPVDAAVRIAVLPIRICEWAAPVDA